MVSVRARAFIAAARLQRKKSFYATAAGMRRRLSAHQSAARCEPPRSVRRHRRITRHEVQGHSCYTLHPDGRWDGCMSFIFTVAVSSSSQRSITGGSRTTSSALLAAATACSCTHLLPNTIIAKSPP
ncbi:hypothetical protein E3G59_002618 [Mycobacteroides abscessus]|nr:hypothetical protein [Mycobacteroides abscessus]